MNPLPLMLLVLAQQPANPYRTAVSLAGAGQADSALSVLEQALSGGAVLPPRLLRSDTSLRALRGSARFASLLRTADARFHPCASREESRRFDFWIGDWDVYNPQGRLAGRNIIEPISGGCGLLEQWTDAGGGSGRSLNTFNPVTGQWQQFWVGQFRDVTEFRASEWQGRSLVFFADGQLPSGSLVKRRLTFTPIAEDTVRQFGEDSRDSGRTWTPTYDLRYVRRPGSLLRPPEQGVYVTTLGRDTIILERFTRTPSLLEGEIAYRNPRVRTLNYRMELDQSGHVSRLELSTSFRGATPDTPPLLERLTIVGESTMTIEVHRNGLRDTTASAVVRRVPGAIPWIASGTAVLDQMVRQWRMAGRDSVAMQVYTFGPSLPPPVYVKRGTGGWIEFGPGQPVLIRADAQGRLTSWSGRATTVRTETARVAAFDFDALVNRWMAAEAAGAPAGAVSARDTVRAALGQTDVWIDYGRPRKRGRQVFGALVPFDSIWRLGANAATQIRFSHDVRIGTSTVPAGTYSLFAIPAQGGGQLVINRQVGQWGTQYDQAQDLARIPLTSRRLSAPVEVFTIAVEQGRLSFRWDDRELFVRLETRH